MMTMMNTRKVLLAGTAAVAFGLVANPVFAQIGTITPGAPVVGANNGTNTCQDGTTTGGYVEEHADLDGVHGDSQPLPLGPDYTDQTLCTSFSSTTNYAVSNGPSTSLGNVPGTSSNDLIVVTEDGTASATGNVSEENTFHYDVTDPLNPVLVGASQDQQAYGALTAGTYEYDNTTETLQNTLYSAVTHVDGTGLTGTGSQTENLTTAGGASYSVTTGTSTFDPTTGDVTYTATAGNAADTSATGSNIYVYDNVAGTWTDNHQTATYNQIHDSTGASTTMDAGGLTTNGEIDTPVVTSSSGQLHLGTTTGASYVDINEDDVVIHGGDSSTTVTVNNAGVNIANTTPGTGGTVHFTSVVGGADFTIDNTGALSSANAGLNGGAVTVGDDFWVTGEAQIDGDTWLNANLDVDGDSQFDGDVNVSGNLSSTGNTTLSSGTGSTTLIGQTATNATAGDVSLQAGVANKVVVNADATAANNNVTLSGGSTVALATNVAVSDAGVRITSTTGGANLLIASDGSISSSNPAVASGAVNINDSLNVVNNLTVAGTGAFTGSLAANGGLTSGTINVNNATSGANKISGLANGTLSAASTDAVTGQQLFATNGRVTALEAGMISVNNRVDLLSRRVDKAYQGVAMGFAMNAAPISLANGEGGISGGVGYFQGEVAGAVKAQYVTDSGVGLGINVGFSSDAVGGGVGASIKF